MLHDKTFIGKLREQAPEVIKPLLDILDEVIAKVKLALSKDDSVLPFIENLERLRSELAPEYKSYMETVAEQQGKSIRKGWQTPEGIAAKQGNSLKWQPKENTWFIQGDNIDRFTGSMPTEYGRPISIGDFEVLEMGKGTGIKAFKEFLKNVQQMGQNRFVTTGQTYFGENFLSKMEREGLIKRVNDYQYFLDGKPIKEPMYEIVVKQGLGKGATRIEPTDTPEFKKWFGDSKVVDENGKPLVVYHNTSAVS